MSQTSTTSNSTPTPLSNLSTTGSYFVEEPEAVKVVRVVIWSLASVASLVGNTIVLKATRQLPGRKPLSYHLVSNLAVAEIINIIFKQFTFFSAHLSRWPFGVFACKVTIPLEVLSLFVVTNTLAAIALYRFALIALQYRITANNRKVVLLLSLMWLYALCIAIPLFVYHEYQTDRSRCTAHPGDSNPYQIVRFVLNFGLPYLIMVLSYAAIAFKLKRDIGRSVREERRMSVLRESSTKHTAETEVGDEDQAYEQQREREDEQQRGQNHGRNARGNSRETPRSIASLENDLLKMVYIIIVVFAACYLPYQVVFLLFKFNDYARITGSYGYIVYYYAMLLTVFPSALHPVCYGTMSKFYARAFSRIVLCR